MNENDCQAPVGVGWRPGAAGHSSLGEELVIQALERSRA